MPITIKSLTDAGFFDKAVSILSARDVKQIRGTEKWYFDARRKFAAQFGGITAREIGQVNQLFEQASRAVNAANRARERGGVLPGPGKAPSQTTFGGTGGTTVEYQVVVKYVDPITGGKNSVMVVVTRETPLTLGALESLAAVLGKTDEFWAASGKRGEIERERAVDVSAQIIGISSR